MCLNLRTALLWSLGLTCVGSFAPALNGQDRRDEGRREEFRRDDRGRDDRGRDDRGRDERGRDERGRDEGRGFGGGFPGGGFPGGGFPGGGFPGGGFPGGGGFGPPGGFGGFSGGGFGSFNPTDMLRRMDENNNGMIDPSESSGRARFMLERIARDVPGIDLSRPVSINRLSEAMQRSRDSGRSSSDSGRSSSGSSKTATVDPLVPGFGEDDALPLPLPFGVKGAETAAAVPTSSEDLREAEERLRRYDENRDGVLDRDEIGRSRWSDDPFVYDLNRDGKLTAAELAMRYAKRRESERGSRGGDSSSSSGFPFSRGGGSDRSSGSSGGDPRAEMMVRFAFDRYDANRSGVIEKEEWSNFRSGDPSAADTNKDNKITREELAAWLPAQMSSRFGGGGPGGPGGFAGGGPGFGGPGGGPGFGGPGFGGEGGDRFGRRDEGRDGSRDGERRDGSRDGGSSYYSRRSSDSKSGSTSKDNQVASYRALTPTERLPKGLPEWFARNDANADGQVAMAEYSASWSDSVAREFKQFDLNQDGFVTSKEALKASESGVIRGTSSSSSSSSSSYSSRSSSPSTSTAPAPSPSSSSPSSSSPSPSSTPPVAAATSSPAPAAAAAPAAPTSVDPRLLAFAQNVIKKYDTNGDGALVKSEWDSMSKNPDKADTDGDGRITPAEYATWSNR